MTRERMKSHQEVEPALSQGDVMTRNARYSDRHEIELCWRQSQK